MTAIEKVCAETWREKNKDNNGKQRGRGGVIGSEFIIQYIRQAFDRTLNWSKPNTVSYPPHQRSHIQ